MKPNMHIAAPTNKIGIPRNAHQKNLGGPLPPKDRKKLPKPMAMSKPPDSSGKWTSDPQDFSNCPVLRIDFFFFEHSAILVVKTLAWTQPASEDHSICPACQYRFSVFQCS